MSPARRKRSSRLRSDQPGTVVLDTGGLSKAASNAPAAGVLRLLVAQGWDVATVAPVLVEALRGDRTDAATNRILAAEIHVQTVGASDARAAAPYRTKALRGGSDPSAVDALVGTFAINTKPAAVVLTSDPTDIGAIIDGHSHVAVIAV